ncbi:MAG: hypothetical protein LH477_10440 [Nocardioides sp.]|nr:hypothetical protein [Nocardioides sp.]
MPKRKSSKATQASQKQLERTVSTLETDVESAHAKTARWKKRAKQMEAAAETAEARVSKLEKKLAKSRRAARTVPLVAPEQSPALTLVEEDGPAAAGLEVSPEGGTPDDSWTLTALRAEARSRGLAGYSRKPKADLLAELT